MTREEVEKEFDDFFEFSNQEDKSAVTSASAKLFAEHMAKLEQDRCCAIVFGMAGSDNVAQRTVDAIKAKQ